MEFLATIASMPSRSLFVRMKPSDMMNVKNSIEGINARDSGATFVSVKFSRSFV
jgi:hypothetical protein